MQTNAFLGNFQKKCALKNLSYQTSLVPSPISKIGVTGKWAWRRRNWSIQHDEDDEDSEDDGDECKQQWEFSHSAFHFLCSWILLLQIAFKVKKKAWTGFGADKNLEITREVKNLHNLFASVNWGQPWIDKYK